jgi:NADH-quinone oxidoreductase subunit C
VSVGQADLAVALVAALGAGEVVRSYGQHAVVVGPGDWVRAATTARHELGCVLFDHLLVGDSGGPTASGESWDVVLHVVRLPAAGLLLRTVLPVGVALPSLTGVWAGAAWPEREAAEMAGLEVTGHPDLRPLLLATGAGLHPLRKDTLLVSRAVRPWPGRLEPGEAAAPPPPGSRRRGGAHREHGADGPRPGAGRGGCPRPGAGHHRAARGELHGVHDLCPRVPGLVHPRRVDHRAARP